MSPLSFFSLFFSFFLLFSSFSFFFFFISLVHSHNATFVPFGPLLPRAGPCLADSHFLPGIGDAQCHLNNNEIPQWCNGSTPSPPYAPRSSSLRFYVSFLSVSLSLPPLSPFLSFFFLVSFPIYFLAKPRC